MRRNDATKAEKAFFTINQSAVEIDATELKILNARSKPNAVAARSIVRNGTGTRYWDSFSSEAQKIVVDTARSIYSALYRPPLQTPPRSEELPVAGHGYGSQTLPLIFDLVNIANGLPVEDAGKNKKKYLIPQGHSKPEEEPTVTAIKATERLVRRITGKHASSLGLHPGVYFAITVLVLIAVETWAFAVELAGQVSVIDGDTLQIHGTRIRLWAIDAPESS